MHERARHLARLMVATITLLAVATVAVAALEHTVG